MTATIKANGSDPEAIEHVTIEFKAKFENFMGNIKDLKKTATAGKQAQMGENGIFDPKSWPIVGDVYEVVSVSISTRGNPIWTDELSRKL
jgi:hypothetical protein